MIKRLPSAFVVEPLTLFGRMISYEPFVEAFGELLGTDEFKDHSQLTEKIAGSVSKIIDSQSPFGDIIGADFIRDGGRNIIESVAGIVEQLEKKNSLDIIAKG